MEKAMSDARATLITPGAGGCGGGASAGTKVAAFSAPATLPPPAQGWL